MKFIDLTGQRFGSLTVIKRVFPAGKKGTYWLCGCDCGRLTVVSVGHLRDGHTKSCRHCNCYEYIDESTMRCTTKSGRSFIFDAEDYIRIFRYTWSISKDGYVTANIPDRKVIGLHRLLMGSPEGLVDHINGDPSDNRKVNLRDATKIENGRNQKLRVTNTTGYKGVSFVKYRGKYAAHIRTDRKTKFLGYYDSPVEAALAYDRNARFYFGEFAKPNFGEGGIYGDKTEVLEMAQ